MMSSKSDHGLYHEYSCVDCDQQGSVRQSLDEPVTRGRVAVDRGEEEKDAPVNAMHAVAKGAVFGLFVARQILCNVLTTILSLVGTVNGLLT